MPLGPHNHRASVMASGRDPSPGVESSHASSYLQTTEAPGNRAGQAAPPWVPQDQPTYEEDGHELSRELDVMIEWHHLRLGATRMALAAGPASPAAAASPLLQPKAVADPRPPPEAVSDLAFPKFAIEAAWLPCKQVPSNHQNSFTDC